MALMQIGGILAMGYGAWASKKEFEAREIDKKIIMQFDEEKDKKTIEENFEGICQRCGIKMNEKGIPMRRNDYHKAETYLKRKGFTQNTFNFFCILFQSKFDSFVEEAKKELRKKHGRVASSKGAMEVIAENSLWGSEDVTNIFKTRSFRDSSLERMERIYQASPLWMTIVYDYTYIPATNEEVWSMKYPSGLVGKAREVLKISGTGDKFYREIYDQSCLLAGLDDGRGI